MFKFFKYFSLASLLTISVALLVATEPINRDPSVFIELEKQSRLLIDKAAIKQLQELSKGELSTGWSREDITPPGGTPTLGYGERKAQAADKSDEPLFATAFALQTKDHLPVVLLTADICFWPNELSKRLASRLADALPRERIFLGATHTHDGPGAIIDAPLLEAFFGTYSQEVAERILNGAEKAVRTSLADLEKGQIRIHEISIPELVINRTHSNKAVNEIAVVIELKKDTGQKALITTYSAHATLIAPHPVVSSSNYPGALNAALEAQGWELAGFFAAETAQAGPAMDGKIAQAPGTQLAREYGNLLAQKIMSDILESPKTFQTFADIKTIRSSLLLPKWGFRLPVFDRSMSASLTSALLSGQEPDAHIHSLAINELVLIGHGFELSAEHGYRARKSARQNGKVLVATSFNGEHHFYVVPESSYDDPGYEPTMAFFGPHLAAYIDRLNSYMLDKLADKH